MKARRAWLLAVAVVGAGAPAAADDSAARAERLFREARIAEEHGRYTEACEKLDASNRLERALGTEYNLGVCLELTKRPASARRAYLGAAELADRAGKASVARDARARASKLDTLVPRIVLRMSASHATASVTCDELSLEVTSTPTTVEVDPGAHRVRATAAGRVPYETTVALEPGQRAEIVVALDAIASDRAPGTPPAQTSVVVTGGGAESPRAAPSATTRSPLAYVGLAVAAAGAVSLGIGGFFALRASSQRDEAGCRDGRFCADAVAAGKLEDAKSSADLATLLVTAGGIGVAGGLGLFLFAPTQSATKASAGSLVLSPTFGGIVLEGRL